MSQTNQFSIYSIFTPKRSTENRDFLVSLLKDSPVEVEGMAAFLTADNLSAVEMAYRHTLLGILSDSDVEIIKKFNPQNDSYSFVHALIAATFGLPRAAILNTDDFEKIVKNENIEDINFINLINTLHSVFLTKEARVYVPALVEYFNINNKDLLETPYSKVEIIFIILALYILWAELFFIPLSNQKIILSKVFCVSAVIGIPVDSMLVAAVKKQSFTIENYIYYTDFLIDCLKNNQEKIMIDNNQIVFGSIVDSLYEEASIPKSPEQIVSLCLLTHKILKGDLLNLDFFDQKDKSQQYAEDMQKLILWFFVRQLWSKIANYFAAPEPLVSLVTFVHELQNHDILDDESVERYINFSVFLQENSLVSKDVSLVLFNENTSQFEWNPEFLN